MRLVNPWMIYFASRCDVILPIAIVAASICGSVAIICSICRFFVSKEKNIHESILKTRKTCVTVCIVSLFIAVLVPSKQTCIEMMIADKVTYESVDAGLDTVKEAVDYICDKINEVK